MQTIKRVILIACVLNAGVQAHAQDDIGAIRDRMAGLETRLELIQKEIQFENLRRQQEQQRADAEQQASGGLPYIVSLGQIDERWVARLQHADGVTRTYSVGDLVSPSVRVSDIDDRGVTVAKLATTKAISPTRKTAVKAVDAAPQPQLVALKFLPLQPRAVLPAGMGTYPNGMPPGLGAPLPLPAPIPGMGR